MMKNIVGARIIVVKIIVDRMAALLYRGLFASVYDLIYLASAG